MNKNTKLAALLTLISTTVAGVVVATTKTNLMSAVFAKDCDHEGYHYEAKDGNGKEYWICCKCHEEFFTEVDGVWGDGNEVNAHYHVEGLDKFTYVVEGEEITITGVDNIYDFRRNDDSGKYDITIPEGVTSIELGETNPFKNKNFGTVIIPESVNDLGNLFEDIGDVEKVQFEGTRTNEEVKSMIATICSSMVDTYINSHNIQVYFPSTIEFNGVNYVTNSKAITGYGISPIKSADGHVYYFKNSVPTNILKITRTNSSFGYEKGVAYVNEKNM